MQYSKNFYQIKSNTLIFAQLQAERQHIGYYNLPYQNVSAIESAAQGVKHQHIVVIGIGGSSLGASAIYEFLLPLNRFKKQLHFLETVDPLEINHALTKIDLLDAHFVIISKSGNTTETLSLFAYLSDLTLIDAKNCTIISEKNNQLSTLAQQQKIQFFELAENIGGRFSVFSAVGLVPLAMVGVNIKELLKGCQHVNDSFFNKSHYYEPILEKARFVVENKHRFNINVVFSYSQSLAHFNKWYVQLWAESLGKLNINDTRQALTPVGLIGPVDQHSFLQLIMQGVRDKTVTFIKIKDLKDNTIIPKGALETPTAGLSFNALINAQADATIEAVSEQGDIPYDILTISTVDEYNIAKLMFSYQLLVSSIGQFLQINTYNQPGVERGKVLLAQSLA
jgi:glucose-6-phosphate isomerase